MCEILREAVAQPRAKTVRPEGGVGKPFPGSQERDRTEDPKGVGGRTDRGTGDRTGFESAGRTAGIKYLRVRKAVQKAGPVGQHGPGRAGRAFVLAGNETTRGAIKNE